VWYQGECDPICDDGDTDYNNGDDDDDDDDDKCKTTCKIADIGKVITCGEGAVCKDFGNEGTGTDKQASIY